MSSEMDIMSNKFGTLFRSKRLVYTALEATDKGRDFWFKCNDPTISGTANYSIRPPVRADSDEDLKGRLQNTLLAVSICLPSSSSGAEPEPIGFVLLHKSFARSGSFYIIILPEHQNKGYGREAINWAMDWAFNWADVHRLSIDAISYNERALHLYKSMGFHEDGRMREVVYNNRRWHDLVEFSILEREYLDLRGMEK